MSRAFFITAPGTGQGKTLVTAALCYQLRQQGRSVRVMKPVISGYSAQDDSDSAIVLQAAGQAVTAETIATVSPWRFAAPLSPDYAAALEGKEIPFEAVVQSCRQKPEEDFLLVEGAGGMMSPLSPQQTNLDVIAALGYPVLLVSASYLGCISPILTAIAVLQQRHIPLAGLVLSEIPPESLAAETVLASLQPHLPARLPIRTIKTLEATDDLWKTAPDLTELVAGHA